MDGSQAAAESERTTRLMGSLARDDSACAQAAESHIFAVCGPGRGSIMLGRQSAARAAGEAEQALAARLLEARND